MRKFSITVNGQAYEVEVEEIGGAPSFAAAPAAAPAPVRCARACGRRSGSQGRSRSGAQGRCRRSRRR